MKKILMLASPVVLSLLGFGCGDPVMRVGDFGELGATACAAGKAQIAVYDSGVQTLCGCAEGLGKISVPPAAITCTVSAGTVVFFHYSATKLSHQIISLGTPSFVSSKTFDPLLPTSPTTHAVTFGAAGNYDFRDSFNEGINGRIVAQ